MDIWIPYCGAAPLPRELAERWNFDPVLLASLVVLAVAYGRSVRPGHRSAFAAAMALAILLFVSPLCALTSALFSARVVHHVLLTAVVAPLLVAAIPRARVRLPDSLAGWTAAHIVVFWLWHVPALYAWALANDAAYWLMQLTLLLSAAAFWAKLREAPAPASVAALLAMMVQMGLLGALLTFGGRPYFAPHYLSTVPWGLSPLEDQQLAGLFMWVPASGFYLGAALVMLGRWLGREPRRLRAQ